MSIKLKENGFEDALTGAVGDNKIGWTTHDHANLLNNVLAALVDENGNQVELAAVQKDLAHLAIAPNPGLQRSILHRAFSEVGIEVEAGTMATLETLIGVQTFGDALVASGRVTKAPKAGRKNALVALLGKPKAAEAAPVAA